MPSADSITSQFDISVKLFIIMVLNIVHPFTIKLFNALPNFPMILIMVSKRVFVAPMTKICRKNKKSLLIIKIRSKNFTVVVCHLFINRTSQNWDNFGLITNSLKNERQMHFNTVFILFIINVQHMKSFYFFQLIYSLFVNLNRAKGSAILIDIRKSTPWKILMMRGSENKDSLNIVRSGNILISPSCSRSTKIEASMRSNNGFYLFILNCFFRPIYILSQLCIEFIRFIVKKVRFLLYHQPACKHWRFCLSIDQYINIVFIKVLITVIQIVTQLTSAQFKLTYSSINLESNLYSFMQHIYKSPLKTTKSTSHYSHHSRSHISKAPSTSLQTSKYKLEIKRQIFLSQAYKTILSKLISKNNIEDFLEETSKFVTINDQYSEPYLKKGNLNSRNQRDFPELGRAMLKDGSFIKHYCRLLINKQPQKQQEIKRFFYQKYKAQICEKKAYFQKFFKIEFKEQKLILSQSKAPSVKQDSIYSIKKNQKSLKKIAKDDFLKQDQDLGFNQHFENISKQVSEQTINSLQVRSNISSKRKKHTIMNKSKNKQKQTAKTQIQQLDEMYYSSFNIKSASKNRQKNQTQEQRQKRMLGFAKKSAKDKIHNGNIIKFVDQMSSNKRLKEIYESIKKQREEIQIKAKSSSKQKQGNQFSAVRRSSYKKIRKNFQKTKIYELNEEILQKISFQQRQLLKYFPKINKIGIVDKIKKDNITILGKFKDHQILKSYIVDENNCIQPIYIAIYFKQTVSQNESLINRLNTYQDFNQKIDESAEVLLVNQFRPQYIENSTSPSQL